MTTAVMARSTATTTTAGAFVIASAAVALCRHLDPGLHEVLRTAGPLALLIGIGILVLGLHRRRGLLQHSAAAAVGLLVFAARDLIPVVLAAMAPADVVGSGRTVSIVLLALSLLGVIGGIVAVVIIIRRDLLGRWSAFSLLAVVAARAVFMLAGVIPFDGYQLLLIVSDATVAVPSALLVFGGTLVLHGRSDGVRASTRRVLQAWRSSTDPT